MEEDMNLALNNKWHKLINEVKFGMASNKELIYTIKCNGVNAHSQFTIDNVLVVATDGIEIYSLDDSSIIISEDEIISVKETGEDVPVYTVAMKNGVVMDFSIL